MGTDFRLTDLGGRLESHVVAADFYFLRKKNNVLVTMVLTHSRELSFLTKQRHLNLYLYNRLYC